ncbi:Kef family K(+) transporter [Bartonella sp. B10834G6]|uniref:YbaL family putative K(+) efflux transporter n=1 Tax=Bartonella apis TaxID=1686310 RepID=UPI0018DB47F6|nr:YbaL family putative K(+) efflux transporter [Bartonella apis]MBH9983080.1 Kef family K(+) transporter [Bartonella apis]
MIQDTPLVTTIVVGLCLAFLFGVLANRLRISPLVGYLLAGVIVGPHTGGFRVDSHLINQLAEIGIILLMFGVGLHFSVKDLLSVKAIAIPGAIVQMAVATLLGLCFGLFMGWGVGGGVVFGLALSTASTVVLLRSLQERNLIETERGRIAVGWLIVEDLAMVLALVLIPALSTSLGGNVAGEADPLAKWLQLGLFGTILLTIAKVVLFIIVTFVIGRRVIPWFLKISAQSGSRELFRLSVLAIALGVAFFSAHLFGVSIALGAFFAGMIMSSSELSQRATEETLPLRDAFAVLFFVSVGMLFDPSKLVTAFFPLLVTLIIIIGGKSLAAYAIVRLFHRPYATALTIGAGLAQIGEFSFILAGLGSALGIINDEARDLIVGGAILSILLNPLVSIVADKIRSRLETKNGENTVLDIGGDDENGLVKTVKTNHIILVGFGDIGERIAVSLQNLETPFVIIDNNAEAIKNAKEQKNEAILGNAANAEVLEAGNLSTARQLVISTKSAIDAAKIVSETRKSNDKIDIIAHAVTDMETAYLKDMGANTIVTDDEEIAKGMLKHLRYCDGDTNVPSKDRTSPDMVKKPENTSGNA